jgi:hypothetical protein
LDYAGISLAGPATLTGYGDVPAATSISGAGTVRASGGKLVLHGTVTGNLQISDGSDLVLLATATSLAAIPLNDANQKLELHSQLTINAAESVSAATIELDNGRLNDPSGLAINANAKLTGAGIVDAPLSGSGTIEATGSGATLKLFGPVSGALPLEIGAGSSLWVGHTSSAKSVTFLGTTGSTLRVLGGGTLALTNSLAVGANQLLLDSASATLIDSAGVTLAGGSITGPGKLGTGTGVQGFGTVSAFLPSAPVVEALGGTLDVQGKITGGTSSLKIGAGAADKLKLDAAASAASASFLGASGTLEIGSAGSLTLSSALAIGAHTVLLDGASSLLTDSAGITLAGGTISGLGGLAATSKLTGYGTLSQALSGGGVVKASGGTLDITKNITATNVTGLQIDNVSAGILQIDGTVAAGDKVTFLGNTGILNLNNFSNPDTPIAALAGFNGTVAGLGTSTSFTAPTGNYIDLTKLRATDIASATLNTTTDIVTVKNTGGGSFAIKLSGSYAPGTRVSWTSDGSAGSKLFLLPGFGFNTFTVGNSTGTTTDSWATSASWSTGTPAASPAAGTKLGFTEPGNPNLPNNSTIVMPPTLRQATGGGTTAWTIADVNTTQSGSSLTLKNQGQIFVNATNNFTAVTGSTSNNWTLIGATVAAADLGAVGSQYFENDGILNVVGTAGTGTAKASFQIGNTNLNITGSGQINLYGNAQLTVGANVGVGGQQTIKFISANGHTNGVVTEVSALQDAAQIAGFLPGNKLVLENLGGAPTSESVVDSNGFATVSISVGSDVVDTVTFLGNYSSGAADFTFAPSAGNGGMLTIGAASAALASASAKGKADPLAVSLNPQNLHSTAASFRSSRFLHGAGGKAQHAPGSALTKSAGRQLWDFAGTHWL